MDALYLTRTTRIRSVTIWLFRTCMELTTIKTVYHKVAVIIHDV